MESCGYPDPIPSLCTSRNRLGNRFQDASRAALQAGSSIMDGRIAGALSFPFSLSLSLSLSLFSPSRLSFLPFARRSAEQTRDNPQTRREFDPESSGRLTVSR